MFYLWLVFVSNIIFGIGFVSGSDLSGVLLGDDIGVADGNKEHNREKREHMHHNMCKEMMMMMMGNSMCGHHIPLPAPEGVEEHSTVPELVEANITDELEVQEMDKHKTSPMVSVNETSLHQIIENRNDAKENKDKIETKRKDSHTNVNKNGAQGQKETNKANKKPVKAEDIENEQPNLTTAPQNIIAGIGNIKDKFVELVTT